MPNDTKKILIVLKDKKISDSLKAILSTGYDYLLFENHETALNCLTKDKNIILIIFQEEIYEDIRSSADDYIADNEINTLTIAPLKKAEKTNDSTPGSILFFPFDKEKTLSTINNRIQ